MTFPGAAMGGFMCAVVLSRAGLYAYDVGYSRCGMTYEHRFRSFLYGAKSLDVASTRAE